MRSSTGCLSTIARLIALFLTLLLILLLPLSLLARSVERTLFSPGALSEALVSAIVTSEGVRAQLVENMLGGMWQDMAGENSPDAGMPMANLTPEEYQRIADVIIPADWFREQVNAIVGDAVSWIESDAPFPGLELELNALRKRLLEGGTRDLIEIIVHSWPGCTPQQVEFVQNSLRRGELSLPVFCLMPEGKQGPWIAGMEESLLAQVKTIPDSIPIGEALLDPEEMDDLIRMRTNLRFLQAALRWLWVIPLLLLGLIVVLTVRSLRELGMWWGIPFVLSAFMLGGLGLSIGTLGTDLILELLQERELSARLHPLFRNALHVVQEALMARVIVQALVLLLVGGGLLILTQWLWRVRRGRAQVRAATDGEQEVLKAPDGGPPPVAAAESLRDPTQSHTRGEDSSKDEILG